MTRKLIGGLGFLTVCLSLSADSYQGRYGDCSGSTWDGAPVSGEVYMYSDMYGELEGVQTYDGVPVIGECYRYSGQYCEIEGAMTTDGRGVNGECFIY